MGTSADGTSADGTGPHGPTDEDHGSAPDAAGAPAHPADRPRPGARAGRDRRGSRMLPHFEALHAAGDEPWSFSARAVERLRHERIAALVAALGPRRVLDLGCSLGQLTARLAVLPAEVYAMDLSPTAVRRARDRLRGDAASAPLGPARLPGFLSGSATQLPFGPGTFDVVVASDGLYSWELDAAERAAALAQVHGALAPGGHAILTEHMRPARFAGFVDEVRASPLRVARVTYLYDRPCYQFESWLRAVNDWRGAQALRRSMPLARALCAVGRLIGPAASRHICVVATRA